MRDYVCRICGRSFRRHADKRKRYWYCSHRCRGEGNRVEAVGAFWNKVTKSDGCWHWTAGVFKQTGYGAFWTGRKATTAHRFSWEVANGPIADGLHVLHRCDNRVCVNPAHLFLGTNLDNVRDRVAKGRSGGARVKGEQHGNAKMTDAKVRELRSMHSAGAQSPDLARRFGISRAVAHAIAVRRSWKHVR